MSGPFRLVVDERQHYIRAKLDHLFVAVKPGGGADVPASFVGASVPGLAGGPTGAFPVGRMWFHRHPATVAGVPAAPRVGVGVGTGFTCTVDDGESVVGFDDGQPMVELGSDKLPVSPGPGAGDKDPQFRYPTPYTPPCMRW